MLQDAGIKADSVASSITTKSVRAMVEALIDGERRPTVLAELARGRMRSKIPDLQRTLEGRFDDHHALMCRLHLEHLDHLDAMIAKLDSQIEQMMRPFQPQREFPSAEQLASWAGLCSGNHESAGKRRHGRRCKGNQHLQPVLV